MDVNEPQQFQIVCPLKHITEKPEYWWGHINHINKKRSLQVSDGDMLLVGNDFIMILDCKKEVGYDVEYDKCVERKVKPT